MKLQVECVRVHAVTLPLREPFETSIEREIDRPLLVVEACADGISGFGEVSVSNNPYYYPDTSPTARLVLRDFLAPLVLAEPLCHPEEIARALTRVRGWNLAKAGVEAAVLDLWAKRDGVPLWQFLGGEERPVECGTSIGMRPTVAETVARVTEAVAARTRRVKLKIGPAHDVDLLLAVRAEHPELVLAADANEGYGGPADLDTSALDEVGLQFLEQPFGADALLRTAEIARRMRTPICLDDGIDSTERLDLAMELGAVGALNVKAPRMGSWWGSARLGAWLLERGVPAFCGGLLDTGIGKTFALSTATCPGFVWAADATPSAHHFERDLVDPPVTMSDGLWRPSEAPGIGVEIDLEKVRSDATLEIAP